MRAYITARHVMLDYDKEYLRVKDFSDYSHCSQQFADFSNPRTLQQLIRDPHKRIK